MLRWILITGLLLLCLLLPSSHAQQAQPAGLVSQWKATPGFTGGTRWYDTMNRFHGVLTNMTPSATSGWGAPTKTKSSGEMRFDGSDDSIILSHIPQLDNASAFTYTGWLKQTVVNTKAGIFMQKGSSTYIGIETYNNNQLYFEVGSANYGSFTYDPLISSNQWFHLAVVFNGAGTGNAGRLQMYVNGKLMSLSFSGTIPSTLPSTTGSPSTWIGRYDFSSSIYSWNGAMDDIRLYNRALSAKEIQDIYTYIPSTLELLHFEYDEPVIPPSFTPGMAAIIPPQQNLVAWWLGKAEFAKSKYWYPLTGRFPGTLTNGASWAVSARKGGTYEMRFDGSDDYVSIAAHPALEPPQRSVLLWMKAQTGGEAYQTLLGHLHASNYFNVFYKPNPDNTIAVYASTTGGSPAIDAGGGLPVLAQTWTHIAVTYTEPTLAIYVNCQPSLSMSSAIGTLNASGSAMLMGAFGSTPGNFYGGALDDVRIYNRALSAQELCSVMRQSPPLSTLNMAFVPSAAPAAPGSLFPFFTPSP